MRIWSLAIAEVMVKFGDKPIVFRDAMGSLRVKAHNRRYFAIILRINRDY